MCGGAPSAPPPPPPPPPPTTQAELGSKGQAAPTRKKAKVRGLRTVASKRTRAKGAGVTVAGKDGSKVQSAKS